MDYHNGKMLLPEDLLTAIQEYIDGEYLYIPRKAENKRAWGTRSESKRYTAERNREIFKKYRSGQTAPQLAAEYFLSVKTVYKIVAATKV